jgi:Tol biopolymer transport system component
VVYGYFRSRPRVDIQLMGLNVDTGAQRIIAAAEWRKLADWRGIGSYVWLPDGSGSIAAVSLQRQPSQVWYAPNDAAPRKVTSDVSAYSNLSVTADGSAILAARYDVSANVWLVPSDGSAPRPLTTGSGNRNGFGGVAWSKGRIVFTTMTKDGPVLTAVQPDGAPADVGRFLGAWSPAVSNDGERVAYTSEIAGTIELWVAGVNGQHLTRVINGGRSPQFFPDGQSLAFLLTTREQTLWRASADGKNLVQLTNVPTYAPAVSRDGKWIICRLRSKDGHGPLWRTHLLSADGRVVRQLPMPRFGNGPIFRWLPDGRIGYVDFQDGVANVWSSDLTGGDERQLTRFDAGQIYAFEMSADGKSLAVVRGDPISDLVLIRDFR